MDDLDDQVHINRVKNGNPGAYAFLVDKYKHMAYTIAVKIVGNPEEAEDTAQESFVKAYQQIHQFQGRSKFSTWLYTIVYRTSISRLKVNRIKTESISNRMQEEYAPDDTMPQYDVLETKDQVRFVKKAIQKLPESEALLVTLYYLGENSIREIQEITGLSVTNIKIKLFRARKKLERELRFLLEDEDKSVSQNEQK